MLNVLLNLALFTIKFIGGRLSNSVSVISDAFNNLTDAGTTMFAWLGLKISSVGAGETHPNGHGRFEWIVALLSASSVVVIGWELLQNSIAAIKTPQDTLFSTFTVVVLALSIAIKLFMYLYNKQKSKEKDSASLKAVSIDCLSDAASTTVVLISLIVNAVFAINIDGWCGIAVSLFILYNGFRAFVDTAERIMGQSASKQQLEQMRRFALENSDFKEVSDLQIEDYGYGRYRVSMTAIGKDNVAAGQLLADAMNLKYRVFHHFGYHAQISVEKNCGETDAIQSYIERVLSTMDVPLQILSLRVNEANDFLLVLLELSVDFMDEWKKKELETELIEKLSSAPEGYKVLPQLRLKGGQGRRYGRRQRR